jgi:transcriptional antiterminator NusG
MEKQWYAVRTFNGYEHKVADSLQKQIEQENMGNLISEIYVPVIEKYTFVRSKLKKKEELLFPGYIFVEMEMTNETLFFVRGVQYVTGYAGISSMKERPSAMEPGEVDHMKLETKKVLIDLQPGDLIKVSNHDMYEGQELVVKNVFPELQEIEVELANLFGENEQSEVLKFTQIEKK